MSNQSMTFMIYFFTHKPTIKPQKQKQIFNLVFTLNGKHHENSRMFFAWLSISLDFLECCIHALFRAKHPATEKSVLSWDPFYYHYCLLLFYVKKNIYILTQNTNHKNMLYSYVSPLFDTLTENKIPILRTGARYHGSLPNLWYRTLILLHPNFPKVVFI